VVPPATRICGDSRCCRVATAVFAEYGEEAALATNPCFLAA
jgi:hypothetical protein